MTEPEVRKGRGEWVLTSDMNTVRKALAAMLRKRKISQNALAALMGVSSTSMFANFLNGKQANMRLDSVVRAIESMGFEMVVREKAPKSKAQERLAALRAEKAKSGGGDEAPEAGAYGDLVSDDDPDRDLKLRMLGGMVDPGNRESLENLFRELRETR